MRGNHTHTPDQIEGSRNWQRKDEDFTAWQKTKMPSGSKPDAGNLLSYDGDTLNVSPSVVLTNDERLGALVVKKTLSLNANGAVHTPATGKKIRIYDLRFSPDANLTDVSFRWGAGGADFSKYLKPLAGGLYGGRSSPNYYEGAIDAVLYCMLTGTGNIQINLEYTEV